MSLFLDISKISDDLDAIICLYIILMNFILL